MHLALYPKLQFMTVYIISDLYSFKLYISILEKLHQCRISKAFPCSSSCETFTPRLYNSYSLMDIHSVFQGKIMISLSYCAMYINPKIFQYSCYDNWLILISGTSICNFTYCNAVFHLCYNWYANFREYQFSSWYGLQSTCKLSNFWSWNLSFI